jgi:DNA-binding NarL/FixJ family response regulator
MSTTILLVDDHQIFREGIRSLIEKNALGLVLGEAGNGAEAVRLADELKPEIILMDISMPVMNGVDATREITKKHPGIRILGLSMESNRIFVVEALKAGASGYLLKDCAFAELADAIITVARGETYLPQRIAALLVKEYLQCIPDEVNVVYETLTSREREILKMIADGKCIKDIGYNLKLSNKTVENQRLAIMQKLELFSVAELTKYAVRNGLSPIR